MRVLPILALLPLLAAPAASGVYSWVDEQGVTHLGDAPPAHGAGPGGSGPGVGQGRSDLRGLWQDGPLGPARQGSIFSPAAGNLERERIDRLVRGALEDLERGETGRAIGVLHSVLRSDPTQPEAHWYLALLARQRGRYEIAEAHLRAFLDAAGDEHQAWRQAAERKLAALADEQRLADAEALASDEVWVGVEHPDFRVSYDAQLGGPSSAYADTVLRFLEEAHREVAERLGATPTEPLGVKLYGKAAYQRAHQHRFSFQTVGFFDGRIHVVSAAHPAGELRALLFHEYTHAVFRERTGGDRPYWLNEGLAELTERAARQQRGLSRSERASLRQRIDADDWLPLRRLAPSFAGLDDTDARAAYLVATAAASWVEKHTDRAQRGRILALLGEGEPDDAVFRAELGLDTDEIDAAVRSWIRAEFPPARASASAL